MEEALGRPRCILETKRVDRRPEKSAESTGFWGQREEKVEFWAGVAQGFGALREEGEGEGKGTGFVRETLCAGAEAAAAAAEAAAAAVLDQ